MTSRPSLGPPRSGRKPGRVLAAISTRFATGTVIVDNLERRDGRHETVAVMRAKPRPLPPQLGDAFTVRSGTAFGFLRGQLRGSSLEKPFFGVRVRAGAFIDDASEDRDDSPYAVQRRSRVLRAREFRPRMRGQHFFSHETAASLWGAPLPLEWTDDGRLAGHEELGLHVSTIGSEALQRTGGVTRHRAQAHLATTCELDGMVVASPATTWAMLGSSLAVSELVVLGDFLCRAWRPGVGRPNVGTAPISTRAALQAALDAGRRRGAARLRDALTLIREDSWSPRESLVRFHLVTVGLPEPELNIDVFDENGRFLGCVDMAYPAQKVAVEYHGFMHAQTWAHDVERVARLRAAGWIVIELTASSLDDVQALVTRVAAALRRR